MNKKHEIKLVKHTYNWSVNMFIDDEPMGVVLKADWGESCFKVIDTLMNGISDILLCKHRLELLSLCRNGGADSNIAIYRLKYIDHNFRPSLNKMSNRYKNLFAFSL